MERRIRLARLRNLNNIYLVPQEDTILFYINVQLQKYGIEKAIVIDAEDTYVSVLVAYVAHQENLHRKRKRVIYDWKKKELCCAEHADVIDSFHIHTGTVAVSGFYGHSKQ